MTTLKGIHGIVPLLILIIACACFWAHPSPAQQSYINGAWTRLDAPGPSPRSEAPAVLDAADRRMILYGGALGDNENLWALSLNAAPEWTQIDADGIAPNTIYGMQCVYDKYEHRMLMYGGLGSTSEVWALGLTPDEEAWSPLSTSGTLPPARTYHALVHDVIDNQLIVYGGNEIYSPLLADLWKLPLSGQSDWAQVMAGGNGPGMRWAASALFDESHQRVLLSGGPEMISTFQRFHLIGLYSTLDLSYSNSISVEPNTPFDLYLALRYLSRSANIGAFEVRLTTSANAVIDGYEVAQGGRNFMSFPSLQVGYPQPGVAAPYVLATIHVRVTNAEPAFIYLEPVFPSSIQPPSPAFLYIDEPLMIIAMTPEPAASNGAAFAINTNQSDPYTVDLYELSMQDNPVWRLLPSANGGPDQRRGHTTVFDSRRNRIILFGGSDDTEPLDDLWSYSLADNTWQRLVPAPDTTGGLPAPRGFHSAVYDSVGDRMVVFGGATYGHVRLGDTWFLKFQESPADTGGLRIANIDPPVGSNCGYVTVRIAGDGISPNGSIELLQDNGVRYSPVSVAHDNAGQRASALFDLRDQLPGTCDVLVTDSNAEADTLRGAFRIDDVCEEPELWVNIVGRRTVRLTRPNTYFVYFGNSGAVDIAGAFLWITGIPLSASVNVVTPILYPGETPPDSMHVIVEAPDEKIIPLYLPYIPAGAAGYVQIEITFAQFAPCEIGAEIDAPFLTDSDLDNARTGTDWPSSKMSQESGDCIAEAAGTALAVAGIVPGVDCGAAIAQYSLSTGIQMSNMVRYGVQERNNLVVGAAVEMLGGQVLSSPTVAAACGSEINPVVGVWYSVVNSLVSSARTLDTCFIDPFRKINWGRVPIEVVGSQDPNEKTSAVGDGENGFVAAGVPASYMVHFENLSSATAPAQRVVVTDVIDQGAFDFATVRFGAVAVAGKSAMPFPVGNTQSFRIDMRPELNILVDTTIEKLPGGTLQWTMQAIDPETNSPPEDPLAGFLPPNMAPPEGEGFIAFSVSPLEGLMTGTSLQNVAAIVFDENPEISTNTCVNVLDSDLPASAVDPLPTVVGAGSFGVTWTSSDATSGVRFVSVYVSTDNGPFELWLSNATDSEGVFTGAAGHTYGFYSIARDGVGNEEVAPTAPDAYTTVTESVPVWLQDAVVSDRKGVAVVEWRIREASLPLKFHVFRAEKEIGPYVRLTEDPVSGVGGLYLYEDSTVEGNVDYYYQLCEDNHDAVLCIGPLQYKGIVHYSLEQNFPNGFNASTLIRFGIAYDGPTQLAIYDLAGRRIRTLVDDELRARAYEIVWDGLDDQRRAVPSGVYVYRLTSGTYQTSRKMLMIK